MTAIDWQNEVDELLAIILNPSAKMSSQQYAEAQVGLGRCILQIEEFLLPEQSAPILAWIEEHVSTKTYRNLLIWDVCLRMEKP